MLCALATPKNIHDSAGRCLSRSFGCLSGHFQPQDSAGRARVTPGWVLHDVVTVVNVLKETPTTSNHKNLWPLTCLIDWFASRPCKSTLHTRFTTSRVSWAPVHMDNHKIRWAYCTTVYYHIYTKYIQILRCWTLPLLFTFFYGNAELQYIDSRFYMSRAYLSSCTVPSKFQRQMRLVLHGQR